jgi:hypothetical protein
MNDIDVGLTPREASDLLLIAVIAAAIFGVTAAAIAGRAARGWRRNGRWRAWWLLVAGSSCLGILIGIVVLVGSIH